MKARELIFTTTLPVSPGVEARDVTIAALVLNSRIDDIHVIDANDGLPLTLTPFQFADALSAVNTRIQRENTP